MKWLKKGLIYVPDGCLAWAKTHAMIPTPMLVDETCLRIYISCCDEQGVSRIGYVEVDPKDPSQIKRVAAEPVLDIGQDGTFDENGVLATAMVSIDEQTKYLYYAGFELGTKIRYRILSGMAISRDGGLHFERTQQVPILERNSQDLYFRCGSFVLKTATGFKLWYVAGSGWATVKGQLKPCYNIKYLESVDGIHWPGAGQVCIDVQDNDEYAFGRPYIVHDQGLYKMFYSIRKHSIGYCLGYAESIDGLCWQRKDAQIGLDISPASWDSTMICYAAPFTYQDKTYLFYNGNDFGKTGFGYAELQSE